LFKEKNDYFIEYGRKGEVPKSYMIEKQLPNLDSIDIPNYDHHIKVTQESHHYFDMLIFKNGINLAQFIPLGSSVFMNRDCMCSLDNGLGFLFKVFEELYNEHKIQMKKNKD
jgi:hypothetical protein